MELKSVASPVDYADELEQIAVNLFYGWGYNFYRDENNLRADDLLVRGKASELIGEARAHVADIETAYRREHLPPPSREHPYPNAAAVATARQIADIKQHLETLETQIRNAAVPEMGRVQQRHRNEKDTLKALVGSDAALVDAVYQLQQVVLAANDVMSLQAGPVRDAENRVKAAWSSRTAAVSPLAVG